jgi:DNA polymerase III subunit delta'
MTESYPWHEAAWARLQRLRTRLPHAILFYGPQGTGKAAFAERVAQSLLCSAPSTAGNPCEECPACRWFVNGNHPDYRRVRPEILDDAAPSEAEEGEAGEGKKGRSKPSKEIKIDQIRALADFMNISTHRQGMRVVLMYPAEALNMAAANALLKTLEEPPAHTVFLLVCNSIDRLLPTVLSRCRKFVLPMPSREQALAWLERQGVANAGDWLAELGGAPLMASAQAAVEAREVKEELLHALSAPGIDAVLQSAERLQKAAVPELVIWTQRWLYDMFSLKLCGRIRYYPRYRKQLQSLAQRAELARLMRALKSANERRAIAEHPLAARLFIEDMLLDYASVFSP